MAAIYLAAQFPSTWATLALAVLGTWSFLARPDERQYWLPHYLAVIVAVSLIAALFCVQLLFSANELKPSTFVHLVFYVLMLSANTRPRRIQLPLLLVKLVTLLNVVLLLGSLVAGKNAPFWVLVGDSWRFEAYFTEPARAACFYALNIIILAASAGTKREKLLYGAVNLLCLSATYSGSGIGLLALALIPFLARRQFYIVLPLLLLSVWLWAQIDHAFSDRILARIENIAALTPDNSTYQRFISPWLAFAVMLTDLKTTLLGMGIGGIESYILENREQFNFLYVFWMDAIVPKFANGYIVIFAWFGIPLGTLVTSLWLVQLLTSKSHPALKTYAVFYPLFAAWLLHPYFLLVYFLATAQSQEDKGNQA